MNTPELRDIHLPDTNLWWPPAPGWWLVAGLMIVLILLLPRLRRWWRYQPVKRVSLRELERIRHAYREESNGKMALNEIAALLRRITISYFGRQAQAATTGDEWKIQLQRLAADKGFTSEQLELLSRGRYRADTVADIDVLLQACERWLRALPRRENCVSA
jgi:hypothetical protein